jgi:chemotaxis protein MotB
MAKNQRTPNDQSDMNTDGWMVTFSDLVMLMLTFFVLLLTMSSMDQKKLKESFSYLQESTGLLGFSGYGEVDNFTSFVQNYYDSKFKLILKKEEYEDLLESIGSAKDLMDNAGSSIESITDIIDLIEDERGLVLSLQAQILFESGSEEIQQKNHEVLDTIAEAIATCTNDVLIMGHADYTPVKNNTYESNWELSVYRALRILDYFVDQKKLPVSRFYVGGYGSSRHIYPIDDPEKNYLNRRVEIIFKHK